MHSILSLVKVLFPLFWDMVLYDSNEAEQQDIKITYIVHPQIILDNLILGPYKEP